MVGPVPGRWAEQLRIRRQGLGPVNSARAAFQLKIVQQWKPNNGLGLDSAALARIHGFGTLGLVLC